MSINRFPYQDIILRRLETDGTASASQIADEVAAEGRHSAEEDTTYTSWSTRSPRTSIIWCTWDWPSTSAPVASGRRS